MSYAEDCGRAGSAMRAILERLRPDEFPARGCWEYVREPEVAALGLTYMQAEIALLAAWRDYRDHEHPAPSGEASPPNDERPTMT